MHRVFAAGTIALILLFSTDAVACHNDRTVRRPDGACGPGARAGFCERESHPSKAVKPAGSATPPLPGEPRGRAASSPSTAFRVWCARCKHGDVRICSR